MRRRVLLGGGMDKTVLLRNFNAASGQTFTQSAGFTAASNSVLTLFLDFTFTGNQGDGSTSVINNVLCAGISPQEWNDTCCRLYTGNGDPAKLLVVGFDDGGQQYFSTGGSLIRRNKAVLRIHYNTGTCDLWLNGQQIAQSFGGFGSGGQAACLGAVSISNAEGSSRFRGTYHEISLLPSTLRDEQLRALTE